MFQKKNVHRSHETLQGHIKHNKQDNIVRTQEMRIRSKHLNMPKKWSTKKKQCGSRKC